MSQILAQIIERLALEQIEHDLFRGQNVDLRTRNVFGGQVLAQALSAATRTVAGERRVHSLHAYFLRSGDLKLPIVFHVDRIRDGASFTTRRVVAVQSGRAIFNLAASFQKPEVGFEHQQPMPDTPPPERCMSEREHLESFGERLPTLLRTRPDQRGFELRTVDPIDDLTAPSAQPPIRKVWLRATGEVPADSDLHTQLLVFASDFMFLTTSLLPHRVAFMTEGMHVASLDHVMWFHAPVRVDAWLLYVMESPAAAGARGLVRGRIYTREGTLVASTAQEGLIRHTPAP
jgi:acyl-CoA thioesterase II